MRSSILLAAMVPMAFAADAPAPTANPDWLTGLNDAQTSALNAYETSVTGNTKDMSSLSAAAATATATATYDYDAWLSKVQVALQSQVTATKSIDIPSFPTEAPDGIRTYYSSFWQHEASILKKQQSGNGAPMETGYAKMAGAAAAGVLGVAAML